MLRMLHMQVYIHAFLVTNCVVTRQHTLSHNQISVTSSPIASDWIDEMTSTKSSSFSTYKLVPSCLTVMAAAGEGAGTLSVGACSDSFLSALLTVWAQHRHFAQAVGANSWDQRP